MAQKSIWSSIQGMVKNWTSILEEEVAIKAEPQALAAKSSEVARKTTAMRRHFEDLNSLIRKTKEYWIGDAGEEHRREYEKLTDEIEQCLRRLEEHPRDLVEIAQRYTDVELRIEMDVQGLPGDVC